MTEKRREITVEEYLKAKEKGLSYILDNIEVSGKAVIKRKDGSVKAEIDITRIEDD